MEASLTGSNLREGPWLALPGGERSEQDHPFFGFDQGHFPHQLISSLEVTFRHQQQQQQAFKGVSCCPFKLPCLGKVLTSYGRSTQLVIAAVLANHALNDANLFDTGAAEVYEFTTSQY